MGIVSIIILMKSLLRQIWSKAIKLQIVPLFSAKPNMFTDYGGGGVNENRLQLRNTGLL